jgi:hypothetical protein
MEKTLFLLGNHPVTLLEIAAGGIFLSIFLLIAIVISVLRSGRARRLEASLATERQR